MIGALVGDAGSFEFFQAIELLLDWLARRHDMPRSQALDKLVRFANSRDLAFPPGDLAAVAIDTTSDDTARAVVTPLLMGLTGTHGVLPLHYTARLAAADNGTPALLDLLSSRFVRHLYRAWRKQRVRLPALDSEADTLLPPLLALTGQTGPLPVPDNIAACYAGAFAHRAASSAMIESVLADSLRMPVALEPNAGHWAILPPALRAQLGGANACIGRRCIIGGRMWRRDLRVRVRIGPMNRASYDSFMPGGDQQQKLTALLAMFHVPGLEFEIVPVLAAADVKAATLATREPGSGARLGRGAFLLTRPEQRDRDEICYLVRNC